MYTKCDPEMTSGRTVPHPQVHALRVLESVEHPSQIDDKVGEIVLALGDRPYSFTTMFWTEVLYWVRLEQMKTSPTYFRARG